MKRVLLLALCCLASPVAARRAAPTAEFSFFSLFQGPSAHAARVLRHASPSRRHRASRVSRAHAPVSGDSDRSVVSTARSQIGNGPVYGRRTLWCARFLNWVLEQTGHKGTGSDEAASFAALPRSSLQVGAIAVMRHHVGIVSGITPEGNPVVISGNHGRHVRESEYPARRIVKYVEVR